MIGPEGPLVDGLGDSLRANGIAAFGPDARAAQIEGSKGFTKDLCQRAAIPTAPYTRVTSAAAALSALDRFGLPVVIKADGLAAGKGVTIAATRADAEAAIDGLFVNSGDEAVIEAFMDGEEASLFVITDGQTIMPFGSAQDHKRVGDGDVGPNTGGMGAYSPAMVLTPALEAKAIETIIAPTVRAMADAGMPFSGVLYAGLMLTADGPKLIEYNARFGDPECQVLMTRLESDLLPLMLATAEGRLHTMPPPVFSKDVALTVVMAARGYPATPQTGGVISNIAAAHDIGAMVFQAGTRMVGDTLVASGGRVLAVTATGTTVATAHDAAYRGVDAISFPGGFCRRDIGWRAIDRNTD